MVLATSSGLLHMQKGPPVLAEGAGGVRIFSLPSHVSSLSLVLGQNKILPLRAFKHEKPTKFKRKRHKKNIRISQICMPLFSIETPFSLSHGLSTFCQVCLYNKSILLINIMQTLPLICFYVQSTSLILSNDIVLMFKKISEGC